MRKLFAATVLYALGFTVCAFAAPDPAFYRPHERYVDGSNQIFIDGGKIYVLDHHGWFSVKSLKTNSKGVYYTTNHKKK